MPDQPIPQIAADEKFTEMATRQQLINPFEAETSALKSRMPSQLLSHEAIRLSRLNSFNSLFRQAQPAYHASIKTGNFTAAASIANGVKVAAQAVGTMLILLCFMVGSARAQTVLPSSIKDVGASENFDYLAQRVDKLTTQFLSVSSGPLAGTIFQSTYTYLPGQAINKGQLGPCVVSTVTITTGNWPLEVTFSGSMSYASTHEVAVSFLIDGTYISPLSVSLPALVINPISSGCGNASFRIVTSAVAAGSHTACLTVANNTAAANVTVIGESTKCPYESAFGEASQFGFREFH